MASNLSLSLLFDRIVLISPILARVLSTINEVGNPKLKLWCKLL